MLLVVANSYSNDAAQLPSQKPTHYATGKIVSSPNLIREIAKDALPVGGVIQPNPPSTQPALSTRAAGHITTQGTQMQVHQLDDKLTVHWDAFDIGENASVQFKQPNSNSIALNKIKSQNPSQIHGQLKANGQVWLVNQSGILFGKKSTVNVGGLVASTLDINQTDFEQGSYQFSQQNQSSKVINEGDLSGSSITLMAAEVINDGNIVANDGQASLLSGEQVTLGLDGWLIEVSVDRGVLNGLVENNGAIMAPNGTVQLTAGAADALLNTAVNNTGVIEAHRLVNRNGDIYLEGNSVSNAGRIAADGHLDTDGGVVQIKSQSASVGQLSANGANGGQIKVESGANILASDRVSAVGNKAHGGKVSYLTTGKITKSSTSLVDVSGVQQGGTIENHVGHLMTSGEYRADGQTGGRIDLTASGDLITLSAKLSATGSQAGGLIRLGGAYQGGKATSAANDSFVSRWADAPVIMNAKEVTINDSTAVDVSSAQGVGGGAVIWSDRETVMLGSVNASGPLSGGLVEISSAEQLAAIDLSNVNIGAGGQLLIDPKNIYIRDIQPDDPLVYNKVIGFGHLDTLDAGLEAGDLFGKSVALDDSGLLMAVGAPLADGVADDVIDSGAVYLYRFDDYHFSGGTLESVIAKGATGGKNIDVDLGFRDQFGAGVALSGDASRLVVGAVLDSGFNDGRLQSGAVHIFDFDQDVSDAFNNGEHVATIGHDYANSGRANDLSLSLGVRDQFGSSVAINQSGNVLLVGASGDDGFGNAIATIDSGAAYLFEINGGSKAINGITLTKTIGANYVGAESFDMSAHLDRSDLFGFGVALNGAGDRFAIGATGDDGFNNLTAGAGAVHLFSASDLTFAAIEHEAVIGSGYTGGKNIDVSLDIFDAFGSAVAFTNNAKMLIVGAISDDGFDNVGLENSLPGDTGVLYTYEFDDELFDAGRLFSVNGFAYAGDKDFNSLIDASDYFGSGVAVDAIGEHFAVGARGGDGLDNLTTESGEVFLFSHAHEVLHGNNAIERQYDEDIYITPHNLTTLLNAGTDVNLLASNDIFVVSDIVVNNPTGSGGALNLTAGRSINIAADIITDNADLTLIANGALDNGVLDAYRDAGEAVLSMTQTASIDAGLGSVEILLQSDPAKTNNQSGDITLSHINAAKIKVVNDGASAGSGVVLNGQLSTSSNASDAIVLVGDHFTNNVGANVLEIAENANWQIWTNHPDQDSPNGLQNDYIQYDARYGETATAQAGNGFLYTVAPKIQVDLVQQTEKVYDANTQAVLTAQNYAQSGEINQDVVMITKPAEGAYADKHVGVDKMVSSNGITIVSANNNGLPVYGYGLVSDVASGEIGIVTPKPLTITFDGLDKVYDGNASANVLHQDDRINGDALNILPTAAFVDSAVGTKKSISLLRVALDGEDAQNYVVTYNDKTSGDILPLVAQGQIAPDLSPAETDVEVAVEPTIARTPEAVTLSDFEDNTAPETSPKRKLAVYQYAQQCTRTKHAKQEVFNPLVNNPFAKSKQALSRELHREFEHPVFGCYQW